MEDPASAASSVASAGILGNLGLGPRPVHEDPAPAGAEQSSVATYDTRGQCPSDTDRCVDMILM